VRYEIIQGVLLDYSFRGSRCVFVPAKEDKENSDFSGRII